MDPRFDTVTPSHVLRRWHHILRHSALYMGQVLTLIPRSFATKRLRCSPSSLFCCYHHFLTIVSVKLSNSISLSACLCKYGPRACHCIESRPSFKGVASSADPVVVNNLTPYCIGLHGSLRGRHYCLRQADCRVLEGSTDGTACRVVIGLEFCTQRRVFNKCCYYLVAECLPWYNISPPALHLGPWSGP